MMRTENSFQNFLRTKAKRGYFTRLQFILPKQKGKIDMERALAGLLSFGFLGGRSRGLSEIWVLQFHAGFAIEDGAAVWESGCLVCSIAELALGIGFWKRSAVLDHLQEPSAFFKNASRATAEWGEIPALARFDGGTTSGSETQTREISENIGWNEPAEGLGPLSCFISSQGEGTDQSNAQDELHSAFWR